MVLSSVIARDSLRFLQFSEWLCIKTRHHYCFTDRTRLRNFCICFHPSKISVIMLFLCLFLSCGVQDEDGMFNIFGFMGLCCWKEMISNNIISFSVFPNKIFATLNNSHIVEQKFIYYHISTLWFFK